MRRRRPLNRAGWVPGHFLYAGLLSAIAIFVTRDAWIDIASIAFKDEESSHIFLVPLISAWMLWARRIRLRVAPPGGTFIGPVAVGIGWLAMWFGYGHAIQALWHAGAVLTVVGAALSILGRHVLVRFFPAFLVLAFLVPVPGSIRQAIAIPLQSATADATQAVLEVIGLDIERSGNLIIINGEQVAVAEACNGMRMVFALVLVSYAFAFSIPLRQFVRLIILLASPIAALVCNVIRLCPTVWLYGKYGVDSTFADAFHDWSGWLMLPVAFLMLLGIIRLLRWALIPVTRFNLAYST